MRETQTDTYTEMHTMKGRKMEINITILNEPWPINCYSRTCRTCIKSWLSNVFSKVLSTYAYLECREEPVVYSNRAVLITKPPPPTPSLPNNKRLTSGY